MRYSPDSPIISALAVQAQTCPTLIAETEQKVAAHNAAATAVVNIAVEVGASIAAAAVAYSAVVPEPQNAVPLALDNEAQAAVAIEE